MAKKTWPTAASNSNEPTRARARSVRRPVEIRSRRIRKRFEPPAECPRAQPFSHISHPDQTTVPMASCARARARDSFAGSHVSSRDRIILPVNICSHRTAIATQADRDAIVIRCLSSLLCTLLREKRASLLASLLTRTVRLFLCFLRFPLLSLSFLPSLTPLTRFLDSRAIDGRSDRFGRTVKRDDGTFLTTRTDYDDAIHVTTSRWPISNCGGESRGRARHGLRPRSAALGRLRRVT